MRLADRERISGPLVGGDILAEELTKRNATKSQTALRKKVPPGGLMGKLWVQFYVHDPVLSGVGFQPASSLPLLLDLGTPRIVGGRPQACHAWRLARPQAPCAAPSAFKNAVFLPCVPCAAARTQWATWSKTVFVVTTRGLTFLGGTKQRCQPLDFCKNMHSVNSWPPSICEFALAHRACKNHANLNAPRDLNYSNMAFSQLHDCE
jgi:hypothetical protein